jgi:hypothetical protein
MEAVIVYESMFGMTHDVADAVADGIRQAEPGSTVTTLRVTDADPARAAAADLLVVGGPTHMRGMTSGMSRKMATKIEQKSRTGEGPTMGHGLEPDVESTGLRDWFHALPKAPRGRHAAAFDTRGEGPMVGSAAKGIAHRLERHGYELVGEPEGFLVVGDAGLLGDGEVERARTWGADLVRRLTAASSR